MISEDRRKRSDQDGLLLYTCARCGRMFRAKRGLGSQAGARVSVCGAILDPPEARCMLEDDFGKRWWPKNKPMPDLLEIDRRQRRAGDHRSH